MKLYPRQKHYEAMAAKVRWDPGIEPWTYFTDDLVTRWIYFYYEQ